MYYQQSVGEWGPLGPVVVLHRTRHMYMTELNCMFTYSDRQRMLLTTGVVVETSVF